MATNPYVNKVQYGGNTLIDISDTTATPDKVQTGFKFYDASGRPQYGTASQGQGIVVTDTPDAAGGTVRTITGQLIEPYAPIGKNATLIKTINLPDITAADTDYEAKKSVTTAQVILTAAAVDTITANMGDYNYMVRWYMSVKYAYESGAAQSAMPITSAHCFDSVVARIPSNYTNKEAGIYNYNNKMDTGQTNILDYYSTSGARNFAQTTNGIIISTTTFGYSNRYNDSITLTIYSSAIQVSAVNSSYFSAAARSAVDTENTTIKRYIEIYQFEKGESHQLNRYRAAIDLSNSIN